MKNAKIESIMEYIQLRKKSRMEIRKQDFTEMLLQVQQSPLLSLYQSGYDDCKFMKLQDAVWKTFLEGDLLQQVLVSAETTGNLEEAFLEKSFVLKRKQMVLDNVLFLAVPKDLLQPYARKLMDVNSTALEKRPYRRLFMETLFLTAAGADGKYILRYVTVLRRKKLTDSWVLSFLLWILAEYGCELDLQEEADWEQVNCVFLAFRTNMGMCMFRKGPERFISMLNHLMGCSGNLPEMQAGVLRKEITDFLLWVQRILDAEGESVSGYFAETPQNPDCNPAGLLAWLLDGAYDLLEIQPDVCMEKTVGTLDFILLDQYLRLEEIFLECPGMPKSARFTSYQKTLQDPAVKEWILREVLYRPGQWLKMKLFQMKYITDLDLLELLHAAHWLEEQDEMEGRLKFFWMTAFQFLVDGYFNKDAAYLKYIAAIYAHTEDFSMRAKLLREMGQPFETIFWGGFPAVMYPIKQEIREAAPLEDIQEYITELLPFLIMKMQGIIHGERFRQHTAALLLDALELICLRGGNMEDYADGELWDMLNHILKTYWTYGNKFWQHASIALESRCPQHLLQYAAEHKEELQNV